MKIVKLTTENIKRLTAVEITPEGALVTVSGKNGAGKSSVLDSIAYALGGSRLVPPEPIRAGETEARIEVDLGDMLVIRKFKRDLLEPASTTEEHGINKTQLARWSPTTSSLIVRTKDGASYAKPQAVLDALLGKLAFDPLAFSRSTPKEQRDVLQKLVGLDTGNVDKAYQSAYGRRTDLKRELTMLDGAMSATLRYDDVPQDEISMDEISHKMLEAEEARKREDDAHAHATTIFSRIESLEGRCQVIYLKIEQHTKEIANLQATVGMLESEYVSQKTLHVQALAEADEAIKAVQAIPNIAGIRDRIGEIESINAKVRANQKYDELKKQRSDIAMTIALQTDIIEGAAKEKERMLMALKYPVDGLGLGSDGVLFNNVPFEQTSTAEQLRVSVAIGIALNPTLKVLLIRDGNALDNGSLKLVAEQAEAADVQVWLERVAESPEGAAIYIEDGARLK